jgi:hypothetical protein
MEMHVLQDSPIVNYLEMGTHQDSRMTTKRVDEPSTYPELRLQLPHQKFFWRLVDARCNKKTQQPDAFSIAGSMSRSMMYLH